MSGRNEKSVNLHVIFNSAPEPVRLCTIHPGAVRRLVDEEYAYWKDGKLIANFDSRIRTTLARSVQRYKLDPFEAMRWLTETFEKMPQTNKSWAVRKLGPISRVPRGPDHPTDPNSDVIKALDAELEELLGDGPDPEGSWSERPFHEVVFESLLDETPSVPAGGDLRLSFGSQENQAHYRKILDEQNAACVSMTPGVPLPEGRDVSLYASTTDKNPLSRSLEDEDR